MGVGYSIVNSDVFYQDTVPDNSPSYSLTAQLDGLENSRSIVAGYNFSDYFGLQAAYGGGDFNLLLSGQITFPVWERVSPLIDIGIARYSDEDAGFSWSETVTRIGLGVDIYWESSTLQLGWYNYGDINLDVTGWAKSEFDEYVTQASIDIETTAFEARYLYNF